jgi:hypothetical protein
MSKLISDGKFHEILEGHHYATQKSWIAGFGPDDREVQLALYLEIIDMYDATGDKKFEKWPIALDTSIVVAYPGPKWLKQAQAETHDEEGDLYDSYSYGGGVPVTHTLMGITGGDFDLSKFGSKDVKWAAEKPYKRAYFKKFDVALRFANELLKNAPAVFGMIGFILDRPVNMAGDDGWSVISKQAK